MHTFLFALQSYEGAFEKIKATTGIDDIDQLVDIFIQTEDKNFALFNYVNELNNDIEMLQEQINSTEEDIEKFKRESVELEEQRKEILKQLEVRVLRFTIKFSYKIIISDSNDLLHKVSDR